MWIALALIALIVIWGFVAYNSFIMQKALLDEAFSGIDINLKKRFDLIPNLIEAVKGYMAHEKEALNEIIRLRGEGASAASTESKIENDRMLSAGLGRLFALAENYPDLKANTQFSQLQDQLAIVEEDIAQARKYYNGAAREFNIKVQSIPTNLIAALCKFSVVPYFEIPASEQRENVQVDFSK